MKTFNVEQIKNYLLKQDSMGDILYNLSEENIEKANAEPEYPEECPECGYHLEGEDTCPECDLKIR